MNKYFKRSNRGRGNEGHGRNTQNRRPQNRRRGKYIDPNLYVNLNPVAIESANYEIVNQITDLNIDSRLTQNISQIGFTILTPIQDQTIPHTLDGKDIIGIANTGTGKTAAFLIPLIHKTLIDQKNKSIIIAPTRELATQINDAFRDLSRGLNIFGVVCIGGTSMNIQKKNLQRRHEFLICTPGRIKDLAERKWVDLSEYNTVVIDEVDRMFDMGFQKDINHILGLLPQSRQSLFFSATLTKDIETLMNIHLNNPIKIEINQRVSSVNIKQDVIRYTDKTEKIEILHSMLIKEEVEKTIVFINTKWDVRKLEKELQDRGFKVDTIHGDKTQSARQKSLTNFKNNRSNILLATDVAARGLDITNVTHVINYDQPASYDDYIHRIGRTGRGSKKGTAYTFVTENRESIKHY